MTRPPASVASHLFGGIVLAFLLLPILAVVPASLNGQSFIKIPPASYSIRWYQAFYADSGWVSSIINSAKVAALACLFTVVIGTMVAIAVDRLGPRMRMAVMGLVMAPATESIMGSLPLGKAGVGSAVNDTTRQVGGALGIAIIGSVLSSVYGSKIADFLTSAGLPHSAVEGARDSLGGALAIAGKVGGSNGAAIATAAKSAFVDALHGGAIVAAIAAALGTAVVVVWLPSHAPAPVAERSITGWDRP